VPNEVVLLDRCYAEEELAGLLRVCAGRASLLPYPVAEEMPTRLAEATVLFSTRSLPWRLDVLPALRWVHSWSSGVDALVRAGVVERGMRVTCSKELSADAVADHVLGGMLWAQRRLGVAQRNQQVRRWGLGDTRAPDTLASKNVVILGFGNVGRRVAVRAGSFGMQVVPIGRTPGHRATVGAASLLALLRPADFLVLSVPYSEETHHLIGAEELDALGPHGVLVNVARGRIVDEQALVSALLEQRLGGAILDVFGDEPLPPTSPLWNFEEVLITPHVAWQFLHHRERALERFVSLLSSYLDLSATER
jgi:phosphoglycerate dehydrogenase-like enzyme